MENKSQVEIDFLGLNSAKYEEKQQQQQSNYHRFIDSDKEEVETSLSLGSSPSSSSSVDPRRELRNPLELQKKTCEFSSNIPCGLIPYNIANDPKTEHINLVLASKPVYIPGSTSSGFTCMLNDPSINLRCFDRRKINKVAGHNPTVAMARKATLARFLEKRLHRIKQARSPFVIGKSSQNDTDSETTTSSFKYPQ